MSYKFNTKFPWKSDMLTIFSLYGDKEFHSKDIRNELEMNIRELIDRKIVVKVRKTQNGFGVWIYKLNPTICKKLKHERCDIHA